MMILLDAPTSEDYARKFQEQNNLADLAVDNVFGHLLLVHHITRIGKSLNKSNKKKEKLVALSSTD